MSTIKKAIQKKKKASNTENQEMGAWGNQLLQADTVHGTST